MDEDKSVNMEQGDVTFLLQDDTVQVFIFGDHQWHDKFQEILRGLGVEIKENFRSPCG